MTEASWRVKVSLRQLRKEENQLSKILLFGRSQEYLAEGFTNGNISVVPLKSSKNPVILNEHREAINCFTTFNDFLISGGSDSYIKVYIF